MAYASQPKELIHNSINMYQDVDKASLEQSWIKI